MTEEIKEEQPLVSVVIPVYNRSKELSRAIKSVLNQTYQNFEILVVDDGSEEDLRTVCDSFSDQRIKFIRNETHTNANVARNRGIREAEGEYIAMLDSDDEYLPHHLSRRIEKIREWGCDGIFGSAYINNGEEQTLKLSRPLRKGELMINYLLSDGFAQTSSHFYKVSAAKAVLWDESLLRHQDYDFTVRFSEKFEIKSDYEPTIKINWQHKIYLGDNTEKIKSVIQFLKKYKPRINQSIYFSYCIKIVSILNKENINRETLTEFISKTITPLTIHSITFSTYTNIKRNQSVLDKVKNRLLFALRIIINK